MTFKTRVESYIGSVTDTSSLDSWLTAGARWVISRLPSAVLETLASNSAVGTSGLDIANKYVFNISKSGYPAREYDASQRAKLTDADSIHLATTKSPAYYVKDGKIFVEPGGGDVDLIGYPTVVNGSSSITDFPENYEQAVVVYAAIQGAIGKYNNVVTQIGGLSISPVTPPVTPTLDTITTNEITPATFTATTIADLPVAPTYTKVDSPTIVYTETDAALTDSVIDIELAQAYLQRNNTQLGEFQQNMYNELNKFNASIQAYSAEVAKIVRQAELDQQRLAQVAQSADSIAIQNEANALSVAIQNNTQKLNLYQSEVTAYAQKVQESVQTYSVQVQAAGTEAQSYLGIIASLRNELAMFMGGA